jgi:hypothetical protein
VQALSDRKGTPDLFQLLPGNVTGLDAMFRITQMELAQATDTDRLFVATLNNTFHHKALYCELE